MAWIRRKQRISNACSPYFQASKKTSSSRYCRAVQQTYVDTFRQRVEEEYRKSLPDGSRELTKVEQYVREILEGELIRLVSSPGQTVYTWIQDMLYLFRPRSLPICAVIHVTAALFMVIPIANKC